MFKEFKEFAIKGNAIDLAVGVIIGAAFGGIVTSLVKDILMPPIGLLTGGLDFSNKFMVLKAVADGATDFATPADAVKAGRGHLELRQLHHPGDQLPHRRVLHFPRRPSAEQNEAARAGRAGGLERLPGLHDDDSDQGDALPALHHSAGGVISRPSTLSAFRGAKRL